MRETAVGSWYWELFKQRMEETVQSLKYGILPPLRRLSLHITNRCNLKCSHCNERPTSQMMPKEMFYRLLHEYHQMGGGVFYITGGEPSCVPYFFTALNNPQIHFNDIKHLNTNPISRIPVSALMIIKRLKVSLDSPDAVYFDRLVGIPHTFDRVMGQLQGINMLNGSKKTHCLARNEPKRWITELKSTNISLSVETKPRKEEEAMKKQFDLVVFILRGEPIHNGHCQVIDRALELADFVAVLFGSANKPVTAKNPWSIEERTEMLESISPESDRLLIGNLDYTLYTDHAWVEEVSKQVEGACWYFDLADPTIGLTGFRKNTSKHRQPPLLFRNIGRSRRKAVKMHPYPYSTGKGINTVTIDPMVYHPSGGMLMIKQWCHDRQWPARPTRWLPEPGGAAV